MTRARTRTVVQAVVVILAVAAQGSCSTLTEENRMTTQAAPRLTLRGVTDVVEVSQVTGPDSPNKTDAYEIAGQDLGSMFRTEDRTWLVFGDTFGQREPGMTGGGGTEWRSNTLAYTNDSDPSDGITLDGYVVDNTNWASELISAKKVDGVEMTVIPTYGFAANGAMYLYYMSVRHWGEPGQWDANYAGLAKSTDDGQTWTKLDSPRWPGESNFIQVSVTEVDGELYFWAVPAGRFGGVKLMKVATARVEDADAYRYFSGTTDGDTPRWSARMADAATVVDGTVGELSVVWNDYLDSWLMSYTDGGGSGALLRQGDSPWGPWSDPVTLVDSADVPGLYAPFMNHEYNNGKTIYFTLSKWGPYNVFWYRADLVAKGAN